MLLKAVRDLYRKELAAQYEAPEIDEVFYTLLDHYLELPRFILGLEPRRFLHKDEEAPLLEALSRLKGHEPVQYITGTGHFMGMELEVGPGVLIPRPETEGLVRWVLEYYRDQDSVPGRILDAGTGSGCIALALAREWKGAQVIALDRSAEALEVARRNSSKYQQQIDFVLGDVCDPEGLPGPFELIVSNPPYVPRSEAASMQAHVRHREPEQALFVPDTDPLKYYACLAMLGRKWLRPAGGLFVETHHQLAREVAIAFRSGGYEEIRIKKDIFGKERYVVGFTRSREP